MELRHIQELLGEKVYEFECQDPEAAFIPFSPVFLTIPLYFYDSSVSFH